MNLSGILSLFVAPVLAFFSFVTSVQAAPGSLQPDHLLCEYLVNPLGIDAAKPRLSWKLQARIPEARGLAQSAYQVLVAGNSTSLRGDQGDLWNSGKVQSNQSIHVRYAGPPLKSHQSCWWKVRVWDREDSHSDWSQPAFWTMGMLAPEDWKAQWIGLDGGEDMNSLRPAKWIWFPGGNPAIGAPIGTRFFRRNLNLPNRPIIRASCAMAADDEFVLFVNGKKMGAAKNWHLADPIDLSHVLHPGENVVAVSATNQPSTTVGPDRNPAGLIGLLRVEFASGEPLIVFTDSHWRTSAELHPAWNKEGFDHSHWVNAQVIGPWGINPWGEIGLPEHRRLPARMVRHEFAVSRDILRATAYVSGLGFFDLYVNGRHVGDHLMDPGLTGYDQRALYVTFDATPYLAKGPNAVGVVLGNGRYFAPRRQVPVPMTNYGYPKLLFHLRLELDDGSVQEVVSGGGWKLTADGPIRADSEYDGEEYDARKEQPGWARRGFDDSLWEKAGLVKSPGGKLGSQMLEPIRITQVLAAKSITQPRAGVFVIDFGQAFYGVPQIRVSGPRGTRIGMHTAYNVLPDGTLNDQNDRSAHNLDVYVLRGEGMETWHPGFKANATRYLQVTGFPGTPSLESFKGLVLHSDLRPVGDFECSNPLLNRIYQNARWGTRMQNRSVPMEPDRDERMPWSGHPAKTSESEGWAFNVARFYDHFLHNFRLHQAKDGSLQEILPPYWTFNSKDIIWPSVMTIIPDWYYNFYGDLQILSDNYECMKRWFQFHEKTYQKPDYTIDYCTYGDWVDGSWISGHWDKRTTSRPLMSSAYYYNNCRIVARAAKLLNKAEDAKHFEDLANKIKLGFNKRFFHPETNKYESETECSYVLPLAFDLVPMANRRAVVANLVHEVMVVQKGHASVGLIGMQWLMQVLARTGQTEVAYTIATQTTRPSWGYMISKGATTIWERWDTDTQDGGMNGESQKILSGNLEAWFYQALAGINYDPENPGFKVVVLGPHPAGDLKFVRARHECMYGTILSDWKRTGGSFLWNVTVPPNTTATVSIPASDARLITEGGIPIEKVPAIKFLSMEPGTANYAVGSGNYAFRSTIR